jgi:rod shape-determining protein MreB
MDVGIDLGTVNVLVHVRGKGIVLREPSVVAKDVRTKRMIAVGSEARQMLGRTPEYIEAVKPLRDGVIADFDVAAAMLSYFLCKVLKEHQHWFAALLQPRPAVVICVPAQITSVEERAIRAAAKLAGAGSIVIIEEPLAAAIGAGLPVDNGCMVVDIGGGTTDIAVISLGGIVVAQTLRVAGNTFDEAIVQYVRQTYQLLIDETIAEQIKIAIGSVIAQPTEATMEIRGRDLVMGLPKTVAISGQDVREAIAEPVRAIAKAVTTVLQKTPPQLAADILDRGIVLTGGGALLRGLDTFLSEVTGVPVTVAPDPLSCVALGAGHPVSSQARRRVA